MSCGVEAVAIQPNMCEHVCHTLGEDEGMILLNSCQVIKGLALFGVMWQTTQLISESIGKQINWHANCMQINVANNSIDMQIN